MRYDLCVIGAGSGGLTTAAFAASLGAKVVLIERGEMGGDCLNFGCVPSKALIASANRGDSFAQAICHVKRAIATIAPHDSVERFETLGVTVIKGEARFKDAFTVSVNDQLITARRFVIATGSRATIPVIAGMTQYLTNETVFALQEKPEHLLIIGAGAMGVELAQAFNKLGSRVTIVARNSLLPKQDADASAVLKQVLLSEGVTLLENTQLSHIDDIPHSHVLIAAGRLPNLESLNLEASGIIINNTLRTNHRHIYVIGDAAGREAFTHVAGSHGIMVTTQALFAKPFNLNTQVVPSCIFTTPEIAFVGRVTEQWVRAEFANNDRAICEGNTAGFVKIYHEKGRIKGASIVGKGAGEMISLYTLAINKGLKLSDIAQTMMPYPTLSEVGKRAVGDYYKGFAQNKWLRGFVRLVQRF